jgi:hypothetical protein
MTLALAPIAFTDSGDIARGLLRLPASHFRTVLADPARGLVTRISSSPINRTLNGSRRGKSSTAVCPTENQRGN